MFEIPDGRGDDYGGNWIEDESWTGPFLRLLLVGWIETKGNDTTTEQLWIDTDATLASSIEDDFESKPRSHSLGISTTTEEPPSRLILHGAQSATPASLVGSTEADIISQTKLKGGVIALVSTPQLPGTLPPVRALSTSHFRRSSLSTTRTLLTSLGLSGTFKTNYKRPMVARHAQGEGLDARGSSGRTLARCEIFEEVRGSEKRVSYEGDQVRRGGSFDRGESEREGQIAHDGFYRRHLYIPSLFP